MDLPDVTQRFIADARRYVEAMQAIVESSQVAADEVQLLIDKIGELDAALASIPDEKHIRVVVDQVGKVGDTGGGALAGQFDAAARAAAVLAHELPDISADLMQQTGLLRTMATSLGGIQRDTADVSADLMQQTAILGEIRDRWLQTAGSVSIYNRAVRDSGAAATTAGRGWTVFGARIGQVLHWVVAAGAEFLAVAIPAAIALGAGMMVAAQGAQMVQQHMSSLYTATEATANMFHQTIGSALGLHSALQQAQDTANPIVWSVLGGVINILKGNFQNLAGAGLDVMRIFQTFTARVVADFQAGFGTQIHSLLAGMVTDLVMFGQVLGNLGHALISFAAAMPGLAELLLKIADGITMVIRWASQAPAILITVAMAMEEIWRWGGPLAAILTRLPGLIAGFVASGFGIIPVFGRVGQVFQALLLIIPRLGAALGLGLIALARWVPALGEAGVAIGAFSEGVAAAIAGLSALQLAAGAVVVGAIGALYFEMLTAKTGAQQLAASMQQAADAANGMRVVNVIADNIGVLSTKLTQASHAANANYTATQRVVDGVKTLQVQQGIAKNNVETYTAALTQQQRDMVRTGQSIGFLSKAYGVTFAGALELGTQAGIQWDAGIGKSSAAADLNRIKVLNLMAGYKAMGQSAGAVGSDMTALAIQAGIQSSKIQQLTQAWDAYISMLTGGTNSLATFEQGLQNMSTVASSTAGKLFAATGNMTQSTNKFAESLTKFTGKSAQNWQNFNQVVSTGAEQFINWMQEAGTVGVASSNQLDGAIKGIVGQMIPFAVHSRAARAELAGLAAQTGQTVAPTNKALAAFAKGGLSARQLGNMIQNLTGKMGDMASVAAALGNVMQSDVAAMFDKARLSASGLQGDLNILSSAMHTSGTSAATLSADQGKVITAMASLHMSVPTITAFMRSLGINISQAGVAAVIASGHMSTLAGNAAAAGTAAGTAAGKVDALASAIDALHSKSIFLTTYVQTVGLGSRGGHTGIGPTGPAGQLGFTAATPGLHLVGELGPELLQLTGGERLYPHRQTAQMIGSVLPGGGPGGGFGGQSGTAQLHATINVNLDGKQIFQTVQTQALRFNTRNSGTRTGKLIPGP